ncbi:MAG: PKD domain-containing protein [Bacteroidetes bacterium]|nr:PKD domain-containing protein [Bacteroidota bacterium]
MKKIALLFTFVLLSFVCLQAQVLYTISGYVTNLSNVAIPNHTVYVMSDSTLTPMFYASANTNSNGFYTASVSSVSPVGTPVVFHVYTYDCNNVGHYATVIVSSTSPSGVANFSICDSSTATGCHANFNYTVSGTNSYTYNFLSTSTGNPISYLWNFGDGTTSNAQNPTHAYNSNGIKIICLTITTANNCTSTHCDSVYITGGTTNTCHANFSFYTDSLNYHKRYFTNTSTTTYTGLQIQYLWNFGDGTTSTNANPDHIFPTTTAATTYNVCLTMKLVNSASVIECQNTTCYSVTIAGTTASSCQAYFYFYKDSLLLTNTYHFQNYSTTTYTGMQVSYEWNFGDGTTSTLQNPVHTYPVNTAAITYNVCLIMKVKDSSNVIICTNTYCKALVIAAPVSGCQNSFTFTHQNLNYAFAGTINTAGTTTYYWNFGDGSTATGQNVTHTFALPSPGTTGYHVCLTTVTIYNNIPCSDTTCAFVTVSNTTNTCQAYFSYYKDSLLTTNTYHFVNYSTTTYTGLQITYEWNFGDGTTSTLQNPVHTYPATSASVTYNVCLIMKVLNASAVIECQSTYCKNLVIGTPVTSCQNSYTYTHQNLVYSFAGQINSSYPTTYYWNFGDGSTASGQFVSHTYVQPPVGTLGYHVCLTTVTTANGVSCTDTTCNFITISNTSGGSIIQGYVTAGNSSVYNGYVLLYQANNATMSWNLIDTLALDSLGYYIYNYMAVPPVTPAFLVKAVLNSSSSLYNMFAPTFYNHAINWFAATPVYPSATTVFYNISMIALPTPVIGSGNVTGSVTNNGIKATNGVPLAGAELILTDEFDSPLAVNYSAANGQFSFSSLPYGNYKLHLEVAGVNYEAYAFTLSADMPSITNINVTITSTGAIITAIENDVQKNVSTISQIYPNPASADAYLDIKTTKADRFVISIYESTGIRISANEYKINGSQRINLNSAHLATGIYFIKIETSGGVNSIRKLVISK